MTIVRNEDGTLVVPVRQERRHDEWKVSDRTMRRRWQQRTPPAVLHPGEGGYDEALIEWDLQQNPDRQPAVSTPSGRQEAMALVHARAGVPSTRREHGDRDDQRSRSEWRGLAPRPDRRRPFGRGFRRRGRRGRRWRATAGAQGHEDHRRGAYRARFLASSAAHPERSDFRLFWCQIFHGDAVTATSPGAPSTTTNVAVRALRDLGRLPGRHFERAPRRSRRRRRGGPVVPARPYPAPRPSTSSASTGPMRAASASLA